MPATATSSLLREGDKGRIRHWIGEKLWPGERKCVTLHKGGAVAAVRKVVPVRSVGKIAAGLPRCQDLPCPVEIAGSIDWGRGVASASDEKGSCYGEWRCGSGCGGGGGVGGGAVLPVAGGRPAPAARTGGLPRGPSSGGRPGADRLHPDL